MAQIKLTCEQCGGSVELDDTREYGFCKFCKAKIFITPDITNVTQNITKHVYGHQGKDVEELVVDGNKLLELGNDKKANEKFKKAIDIEPKCWDAWLGYASTGGTRTGYLSCVPAYKNAYNAAIETAQEIATFNSMVDQLPDHDFRDALIKAYKDADIKKRHEMFDLTVGVIGCDESEIAKLVIDLCPNDWRVWFAMAKIRQIRVRWVELEGLFAKKLPKDAMDVLNVFIRAYKLAIIDGEAAKKFVITYISTMENDQSYKVFVRELKAQIEREGYGRLAQ